MLIGEVWWYVERRVQLDIECEMLVHVEMREEHGYGGTVGRGEIRSATLNGSTFVGSVRTLGLLKVKHSCLWTLIGEVRWYDVRRAQVDIECKMQVHVGSEALV